VIESSTGWAAVTCWSIWAAQFSELSFGPSEPPGDDLTFSMNLDRRGDFSKLCLPEVFGSRLSRQSTSSSQRAPGRVGEGMELSILISKKAGCKLGVKMTICLGRVLVLGDCYVFRDVSADINGTT